MEYWEISSLTISARPDGLRLYLNHGSKDVSLFVPMKSALHFWNYSMFCSVPKSKSATRPCG